MVFCFSTPATGCWIGATPELLLKGTSDGLESMALAGTRVAYTKEEWDNKNKEEQRIVCDYILKIFNNNAISSVEGPTFTKVTGKIEHICTPVWGKYNLRDFNLSKLLRDLSPTPALCGNPKEMALTEIFKYEGFDRGCYGGFCGPYHSLTDFVFHVVLRCASVNANRCCLYAGGGITVFSEVEKEWQETELKLRNTFPSFF